MEVWQSIGTTCCSELALARTSNFISSTSRPGSVTARRRISICGLTISRWGLPIRDNYLARAFMSFKNKLSRFPVLMSRVFVVGAVVLGACSLQDLVGLLNKVAGVALSPTSGSVAVGQTLQLTATPQDATGAPLSGKMVTWGSSDATIASVNSGGLVRGVAVGAAI